MGRGEEPPEPGETQDQFPDRQVGVRGSKCAHPGRPRSRGRRALEGARTDWRNPGCAGGPHPFRGRGWKALGLIGGILVVLVVHTRSEEGGEDVVRIISARKAAPAERSAYDEAY